MTISYLQTFIETQTSVWHITIGYVPQATIVIKTHDPVYINVNGS